MPDTVPDLGLVRADPEQLGECEIRKRRIRRELENARPADRFVQPPAFLFGALIAPDEGRPEDAAVRVEQHGSVHLTGQSDARDRFRGDPTRGDGRSNRLLTGAPPVGRVLLGPGRARRCERRVIGGRRREERAAVVEDQRTRAAGADVDA
jgi:hypothetical protein